MSHSAGQAINDALCGLPLVDRQSALLISITEDDPRVGTSIASIISVAGIMARSYATHGARSNKLAPPGQGRRVGRAVD